MGKFQDLTGKKFGMLTAIEQAPSGKDNRGCTITKWWWQCKCGVRKVIPPAPVKRGTVVSCGCYNKENNYMQFKHGMIHTKEYLTWVQIKRRATSKEPRYKEYVNRGIDSLWLVDFESFYSHIGDAPSPKHTIDRIDNSIGYFPGNIRWATVKEQNRNYSQNKLIEYNGKTQSVTEWAEELGMKRHLIFNRIKNGWSIEEALTGNRIKKSKSCKNSECV